MIIQEKTYKEYDVCLDTIYFAEIENLLLKIL